MGGWYVYYGWRVRGNSIDLFFIPSVEKKKCLAFVHGCETKLLFSRIEYFMMGWKHSKEKRQFHFDCCTSPQIALWQWYCDRNWTEIVRRNRFLNFHFYARQTHLIFNWKNRKITVYKRHAKITRHVNDWMDGGKEEIKKKEGKRLRSLFEIFFFATLSDVLTKNSILCEIGARL